MKAWLIFFVTILALCALAASIYWWKNTIAGLLWLLAGSQILAVVLSVVLAVWLIRTGGGKTINLPMFLAVNATTPLHKARYRFGMLLEGLGKFMACPAICISGIVVNAWTYRDRPLASGDDQ